MNLQEGDKAPDFTLQDTTGNIVTLNELSGKKIVIYFFNCACVRYSINMAAENIHKNTYSCIFFSF